MAAYLLTRYFLFRVGWVPRPDFTHYYGDYFVFCSHLLRWGLRLRVVGAENCPKAHPVVFAGNHVRLTDPLYFFGAIARASGMRVFVRFMARDDFFTHPLWRLCPLRMHDILEMGGAHFISRDNVKVSQLKPFFEILDRPGSFLMFPGRSRSRSGMVVEYRETIDEPGAVSFFLTYSQRHRAENPAVAVPLTRTYNPVTGCSVVVFGEPVRLPEKASKRSSARSMRRWPCNWGTSSRSIRGTSCAACSTCGACTVAGRCCPAVHSNWRARAFSAD